MQHLALLVARLHPVLTCPVDEPVGQFMEFVITAAHWVCVIGKAQAGDGSASY